MKKIKRTVIDLVPVGMYLVTFNAIWNNHCNPGEHEDCLDHGCFDNGRDYISDVDSNIVKVTSKNYLELPENVIGKDETMNLKGLGVDDTHDFRPRLFKTLKQAKEHEKYTVNRFKNPQPWEAFVKLN